jgi:hypothetical protein
MEVSIHFLFFSAMIKITLMWRKRALVAKLVRNSVNLVDRKRANFANFDEYSTNCSPVVSDKDNTKAKLIKVHQIYPLEPSVN